MSSHVIQPPEPWTREPGKRYVFLAGSIDMGAAEDWQRRLAALTADVDDLVLLNPRRDAWDASWRQAIDNPVFREQVQWELRGLEEADLVAFYFAPQSQAPVTLLELGLFGRSGRALVCCPDGFWRKGNVDIVCARYGITTADSLESLAAALRG